MSDTTTQEALDVERLRRSAKEDQLAAEQADAERQNQEQLERSRVHPLDPDFLLFALPIAIIVDALDLILDALAFLVVPKLIGIVLDICTFLILGAWMYWRIGKIAKTRKRSLGGAGVPRPLRKVMVRGGLAFLVEAFPFLPLGILPFWTITVISTLREK